MPTHAEKRVLSHTPEQMFDLVADIEKYPEFLPWCVSTRIRERNGNELVADMVIGFNIFRERFTSTVKLDRPGRIDVSYADGPFKYLNNHWIFNKVEGGKCEVDFFVDFEFRSGLLQKMIGAVFETAVRVMVSAFRKRARDIYG
ncbi:MAG: ubiquinone-binding protein [Rhodospirillales bacterium RIFCSPLOWO2_12_FULL_58_28]|nr:MAG: ubiquinone-binding protein [Rhodospirillales bacterium RIFCSPLOWO2_02_FULL_58_16]OHC78361.1 MAG: ubiquinone-binding protein [Rhodospirillales bacterium RIFCSPLOWO2_12_FULL_58_28]